MTELFGRKAELQIRDKIIRYPDLHLNFEVDFGDDSDANTGYITVYNLANATIDLFEKKAPLKLKAGYEGNFGTVFVGSVNRAKTEFSGSNKETEIIVNDNSEDWLSKTVNKTWNTNSRAKDIIQDIANMLPISIGQIELAKNKRYPKGKTFSTTIKKALEQLAKDTESKFHISNGRLYFRPPERGREEIINLNKDSGLIATPQRIEDEEDLWKAKSLLRYQIETDSVVNFESKTIEGLYIVKRGSHYKSGNDFYTEMEVKRYRS